MRNEQKFHPVAIDLRLQTLLRDTVEAVHPRAVFDAWLDAGERLPQARATALAFDM